MIRIASAIAAVVLFSAPAYAHFIDGYLGQCSAVTAGTCTEFSGGGYARQPVYFNVPTKGLMPIGTPYVFPVSAATLAGRAVYDAPTGGNLLMVMPLVTPLVMTTQPDSGDVASLRPTLAFMSLFQDGNTYIGTLPPAASMGTMPDGSAVTTGTNVSVFRGLMLATPADADPSYRQVTSVTGFTYQVPAGISTIDIGGAGPLASGTVTLQQAPADGSRQTIFCDVSITTLTLTPGSGSTIVGTAPSSCGANTSHELRFFKANSTWHVNY